MWYSGPVFGKDKRPIVFQVFNIIVTGAEPDERCEPHLHLDVGRHEGSAGGGGGQRGHRQVSGERCPACSF